MSIGRNHGNSPIIFRESFQEIEMRLVIIKHASSIYCTQAWGNKDQNDFLNQVVALEVPKIDYCKKTYQEICYDILQNINEIELFFGRKRTKRWGPRTLDIDILFVEDYIVNAKGLIIPHIEIPNRRFVLAPLNEIAPNLVHPVLNLKVRAMLDSCCDKSDIEILTRK
ncbi:MAG: 2-amino-4-hydroxy-6-hydroxymethyldihydropteridine diphosphokinase [Solitalea-like symbiont of Acarus siro]